MNRKLIVEVKAEELVAEARVLLKKIRYRCKAAKDLENSGDSLILNLGEGVVVFQPKKKAEKYDIARGEAGEIKKALIALVRKGKLKPHEIEKAEGLANEIIAILTTMIKNLEERF